MKKTIALVLGAMLVLGFAVVACGGSDSTAVDWTDAAEYEGQEVTITGPVVAVDNLFEQKKIHKILIRLGGDSTQDHFNIGIVLNGEDAVDGSIPDNLAYVGELLTDLVGKTVEVTGTIEVNQFESVYEIFLNDVDDDSVPDETPAGSMKVVGTADDMPATTEATGASATTLAPTTTVAEVPVYTSAEAWDHIGEYASLTGVVVKVSDRVEKALLVIDSTTNDVGAGTNCRILAVDWDKFGGFEGLEALMGKTITFTGLIETNAYANNKPEIEVSDPANFVIED